MNLYITTSYNAAFCRFVCLPELLGGKSLFDCGDGLVLETFSSYYSNVVICVEFSQLVPNRGCHGSHRRSKFFNARLGAVCSVKVRDETFVDADRRVARNSQREAVLGVWRRSPSRRRPVGGLGAELLNFYATF